MGFGFRMVAIIIKASVCVICFSLWASADNTNFGLENYRYHSQPHATIVNHYYFYLDFYNDNHNNNFLISV